MGNNQTKRLIKQHGDAKRVLKGIATKYSLDRDAVSEVYKTAWHNIGRETMTEDEILYSLDIWTRYLTPEMKDHLFTHIRRTYNPKGYFRDEKKKEQETSSRDLNNKRAQEISSASMKYKAEEAIAENSLENEKQFANSKANARRSFRVVSGLETDVSLAEYCAWMIELTNSSPNVRIQFLFSLLDVHDSGKLDLDDMYMMTNLLFKRFKGEKTTSHKRRKMAYQLFHEMDIAHVGKVSFDRFSTVAIAQPDLHRAIMSLARPLYSAKYFKKFRNLARTASPGLVSVGSMKFNLDLDGVGGGSNISSDEFDSARTRAQSSRSERTSKRLSRSKHTQSARRLPSKRPPMLKMKSESCVSKSPREKINLTVDTSPQRRYRKIRAANPQALHLSPEDTLSPVLIKSTH